MSKGDKIDDRFLVSSVADKKRKCAVCGEAAYGTTNIAASWVCPGCVTMLRKRSEGRGDEDVREAFRNDDARKPTRHRSVG